MLHSSTTHSIKPEILQGNSMEGTNHAGGEDYEERSTSWSGRTFFFPCFSFFYEEYKRDTKIELTKEGSKLEEGPNEPPSGKTIFFLDPECLLNYTLKGHPFIGGKRILWMHPVREFLWPTWIEWNQRIFNGKERSFDSLFEHTICLALSWCKCTSSFF